MQGVSPRAYREEALRAILEEAKADVLVVGHTHEAAEFRCDRGLIVNPGAVLLNPAVPALDLPAPGSFGLVDLPARRLAFHTCGLAAQGARESKYRRGGRQGRPARCGGGSDEGPVD
jgi:hypothetical protein